jgi:hypothetical protein
MFEGSTTSLMIARIANLPRRRNMVMFDRFIIWPVSVMVELV